MEEIITKNNLDTYTTGLKSVLENIASNAGGSSSAGEEITINLISNISGTPYAVVTSGTKNVGTFYNGETVTIPYGVSYTIQPFAGDNTAGAVITGSATVMADTIVAVIDDFVNLGLPSGTLWAPTNIGASSSTDAGLYFSWGNIEGHAKDSGYTFDTTTYASTNGSGLTTSFQYGDASYDAARAILGYPYCMPTLALFSELINSCTWTWDSTRKGYDIVGPNNNSIFLPAAGCYDGTSLNRSGSYGRYWSTEYYGSSNAYSLLFSSSSKNVNYSNRYYGQSIRAVRNSSI